MNDEQAERLRLELGRQFGMAKPEAPRAPAQAPAARPRPKMSDMQAEALKRRLNETFGAEGGAPMTDGQADELRGQMKSTFGAKDEFSLPDAPGASGMTGEEIDAMGAPPPPPPP